MLKSLKRARWLNHTQLLQDNMKATVISTFWDKDKRGVCYNVGDIVDFDEARIADLVAREIVKIEDEPKSEKKKAKDSEKEV